MDEKNLGGRPATTEEQKEEYLRKLEPYLKKGLSINKACAQAELPKSTIYDLISQDRGFSEKIDDFKNYVSILVNDHMSNGWLSIPTLLLRNMGREKLLASLTLKLKSGE